MKRYISDILVVLTFGLGVCMDFVKLGFSLDWFSQALLVFVLAGSFWANYEKDKIIKELKAKNFNQTNEICKA